MLPLKALGKNPSLSLPRFSWLLTIFVVPWLVATLLQSLSPLLHSLLLPGVYPLCSNIPLLSFMETPVIELRAHIDPVRPYLNLITFAKTLFPKKVTFTGNKVRM